MAFSAQRSFGCARAGPRSAPPAGASALRVACRLLFQFRRAALWRRQLHSGSSRLRQTDRDGLLRAPRAVLPFANMMNFFANEFSCLRGWRFSFSLILARFFDCLVFWHVAPPNSEIRRRQSFVEYSETLKVVGVFT
jgi:hypothetical protein